jgi:L,D-peptidoglycan transpeptidase YkuD (ErfK/YbiS/YcfS/YnhG family)
VKRQWVERVRVYRLEPRGPRALLVAGGLRLECRIGRAGATHDKREGDGQSPRGPMRILSGFWRADRRLPPRTGVPLRPARACDGWCDAPGHGQYNRLIQKPFSASHEDMMRADGQYDVVLDLDWNRSIRRQGRGSAIFLHIMNDKGTGSAGCVTVPPGRIDALMARLGPRTLLEIL